MMLSRNLLFLLACNAFTLSCCSQSYIVKDIHSFGAKGDGKTNDHDAFVKAASFFNKRGGNGKLTISPGTYIVGKQAFTGGQLNKPAYEAQDVLHLTRVKNVTIQGSSKTILKYQDGYHFGAFDPANGQPYMHGNTYFVNLAYAAGMGHCIYIESCTSVKINGFEINGNNEKANVGGVYGDQGIQLPHYGIFISNSKKITVDQMHVHHMACDGICVENEWSGSPDSIILNRSAFEFNARQAFTWAGGNQLIARSCKFNHSGNGALNSAPRAGMDIEAEAGPIRNGIFENCEYINNAGAGMAADSGDSGDCLFTGCTFWGATMWSVWVRKPGFTFRNCKIYGSFVHGYEATNDHDATRMENCTFEDKPYNGKDPYGGYLIESNSAKRMTFINCNFIAHKMKVCWLFVTIDSKIEDRYQVTGCHFYIQNAGYPDGDFVGVIRGARMKNNTFEFMHPDAKKKRYFFGDYTEKTINTDQGGNQIIYD